jgi:hypothetical protein
VNPSNRKEEGACNQKAPRGGFQADDDVCDPCGYDPYHEGKSKSIAHGLPLETSRVAVATAVTTGCASDELAVE